MDNKESLKALFREYGYPEHMIHRYIKEAEGLDMEEVKKSIMPFRDITAHK